MTGKELIAFHKAFCERLQEITKAKNNDYAGEATTNAFKNFTFVEEFGVATVEAGMFTRMTDKMSRLSSFIKHGQLKVKGETVIDTLHDLCNYSIIFAAYLNDKQRHD
jgi:hypothetical protein